VVVISVLLFHGYTTLWRPWVHDFMVRPLLHSLFCCGRFWHYPFWSRPFWHEFHKNNFFVSIF